MSVMWHSRGKPDWLEIAPRVAEALAARRPVVGFESTVFAHGLPRPQGLETARRMETIACERGVVPATVGIIDGRLAVGLGGDQIEYLATAEGVAKANLSNLAAVLASGRSGATTVAATMLACDLAGIEVCVTGGIGGVHPGAAEHFDVSADLTALERFRVVVVSSGAKSIVDIGATLQALETRGVPVIGWRTDEFPVFYQPGSEYGVDERVETVAQLAQIVRAHMANPHAGGLLVANPIPPEAALPEGVLAEALARARAEACEQGITGRALTPFLLAAVERHSAGRSLAANIALLINNATLGCELAIAMAMGV